MKAVLFKEYGSADLLSLQELEMPVPKPDEVLVRVRATSINSWDWELMRGRPFANKVMFGLFRPKRIRALGCDVAGVVEAVGSIVSRFKPGDEVFGDLSGGTWGGFAEFTCAREKELTIKPAELSFELAAAMPQAGLLALQGLNYKGEVKAGQKVLINGGGGGAGTFAIQIAKQRGAHVTAVDSAEKQQTMLEAGADRVIDFRQQDFIREKIQYDRIFDCASQYSIADYRRSLSPGGVYAMIGGDSASIFNIMFVAPVYSLFGSRKLGIVMHKANMGIEQLIELFESGKVVPVIDKVYPLEETPKALQYFEDGHVKGKVVIRIEDAR